MIVKKELIEELNKIQKEQEDKGIFIDYIPLDILLDIVTKLDVHEGMHENKVYY